MVPLPQLDRVQSLLSQNGVSFWLDESAISVDGRPFIAVVNFGRSGDANKVQTILDAVP
jgi:hypothetical protein